MNISCNAAVAVYAVVFVSFAGCKPAQEVPAQEGPAKAVVVQDQSIELRYRLPDQEKLAGKPSAARWSLAAPVEAELANPNQIVYDQGYIEQYVHWAVTAPIADGSATYVIVTPNGEQTVSSGLDQSYLGRRFSADGLVEFLKTRAAGKSLERTFRIDHAEAASVLRDHPESLSAKRLRESPWDRDTRMIIQLLGLAEYEPAHPSLIALARDANPGIQYEAIMALGRMAKRVPVAEEALQRLAEQEQNSPERGLARDALQRLRGDGDQPSPVPSAKREVVLPKPEPLANADDAIRRFHVVRELIGLSSDPDERVTANRESLKKCLADFKGTLSPLEEKNCVIFGELSGLDREGECWVVRVDLGLLGGQIAYFDDMGQLLFAWRAPEG